MELPKPSHKSLGSYPLGFLKTCLLKQEPIWSLSWWNRRPGFMYSFLFHTSLLKLFSIFFKLRNLSIFLSNNIHKLVEYHPYKCILTQLKLDHKLVLFLTERSKLPTKDSVLTFMPINPQTSNLVMSDSLWLSDSFWFKLNLLDKI